MRILIVGAGALGGFIGAQLTASGEDVVHLEINQARAQVLNECGLFVSEGTKGERCIRIRAVSSLEGEAPVDLALVAVKSYQTEAAAKACLAVVRPDTFSLSFQNGIGNAEVMARVLGPDRVLTGITYHSVQHAGPNRLRYRTGIKPIQVAPYDGTLRPELDVIGEVFRRAGLETQVVESIEHAIWRKLLHNAVVNPVSALTGLTCAELLRDRDQQLFMRDLCMEIVAIMRARGVPIEDEEDPYRPVIASQRSLGHNRPSMWQDLAREFRTEVDAINGAVVREAERLGLKAPLNRAIVQFMHSRENRIIARTERVAETVKVVRAARLQKELRATSRASEGGIPEGRIPLQCVSKLKEILEAYYHDLDAAAQDPKRRVVWCTGLGPVELLRAIGLTPYFPENHAALIGASRKAGSYISRLWASGFSQFASSEMTCDMGALLADDSPLVSVYGVSGPPRPDVLVYDTNVGNHFPDWFECHGKLYGAPVVGLHPPPISAKIEQLDVDMAVQQLMRMKQRVEQIVGMELDIDRLAEVVKHASEASALWARILNLSQILPSPISFFDTLIHMAPIVLLRGTPVAVEYYRILLAELEDRVTNVVGAVPHERYRFYWVGLPSWGVLRLLSTLFLDHRVAVVAANYTRQFVLSGLDPANPIESIARTYSSVFSNRSSDYKTDYLRTEFERFNVDAVIFHDGRTNPKQSDVRYGLQTRLRQMTGIPYLVLEADAHDHRLFSMERIERKLVDFLAAIECSNGGRVEHSPKASAE